MPRSRTTTRSFETILVALLLIGGSATRAQQKAPTAALGGRDPIALCEGREQIGHADYIATYEGQVYLFASAERAARFAKEPARWAIQLGGACARMGPLSGSGDPQRYLVHERRIYVFASDQCRTGFASDPAACLDRDKPDPRLGESFRDGSDRIARARSAHGLDRFRPFTFVTVDKNDDTLVERRYRVRSTTSGRVDTTYVKGDQVWKYAKVLADDGSFFVDQGTARPMAPSAAREMRRSLWREPVIALRHPHVAHVLGERNLVGHDVTEIAVWIDGCLTAFGLDADDRVRTVRFRGRGPDLRFTEIVRVYDDFEQLGGQLMAHTVRTLVAGLEVDRLAERRGAIDVDAKLDDRLFQRPR